MAVVLTLRWDGATKEQYDKVLELTDWENDPAMNGIFHVVWFEDGAMNIVDLWESAEDWQRFMDDRLAPHIAAAGIEGQPEATFHEVYRYFNTEAAVPSA
jgi:uncharacterized protein YciU (UPF0263 family)